MTIKAAVLATLLTAAPERASVGEPFWTHFGRVTESGSGELILIQLDANGDGRPEIFMAPKWTCGNGGCGWRVYSPTPDRRVLRYLGEAGFHMAGYRLSARTLTHCWHMSAGECAWGQYEFHRYRMRQLPGRSCPASDPDAGWCEKELAAIREWQRDRAPEPMWGTFSDEDPGVRRLKWVYRKLVPVDQTDVPDFDELVVANSGRE